MAKEVYGEFSAYTTPGGVRFQKNSRLVSEKSIPPEVANYLRTKLGDDTPKVEKPQEQPAPRFPKPTPEQLAQMRADSLKVAPGLEMTPDEVAARSVPTDFNPNEVPLSPDDFDMPGVEQPQAREQAVETRTQLSPSQTGDAAALATQLTQEEKHPYTVLQNELGGGVEYPRGVVHNPGDLLWLTDAEAGQFAPGLIVFGEHQLVDGREEHPTEKATRETREEMSEFMESVSIHTADLGDIAQALYERFGIYTVYLKKLPEMDEVNPLTGTQFTKYHQGIAYQAAIYAQNHGILEQEPERNRKTLEEGRAASANFQDTLQPVAHTLGDARRANNFDYRTSVRGTQSAPTTRIEHVRGEDGQLHAVQVPVTPNNDGSDNLNGAKQRYDANEEEQIVEPPIFGTQPIIRPNW